VGISFTFMGKGSKHVGILAKSLGKPNVFQIIFVTLKNTLYYVKEKGRCSMPIFKPLGDQAIFIHFGDEISLSIYTKINALIKLLTAQPFEGMQELVPGYTNLCVYYDAFTVYQSKSFQTDGAPYDKVLHYVQQLTKLLTEDTFTPDRIIEIPVLYGGAFGPDLTYVAQTHDMSEEQVIQLHTESECVVYMLGFAPGFAFMGGMNEKLATPRRDVPRLSIPAGSVGIAGKQTGIYPFETPGGWQIIGRTPLPLFLPKHHPPTLLQAGDTVKFKAISEKEFHQLQVFHQQLMEDSVQ